MPNRLIAFSQAKQVTPIVMRLAEWVLRSVRQGLRSLLALAAETLFLKKQLALYQGHRPLSQCNLNATRFALVWLSYWFDWQPALTIVQPATFKRWRHQGWRLLFTKPAKLGRPPIPAELGGCVAIARKTGVFV